MIQGENQTATARGAGIEIVRMPAELDLTTSEGAVEQGCAAMARPVRLLLLDLTGLSFCDARGLSAFVRIANHADAAGCGFGLIAPRPPVRKILRISGLDSRMPVFATVDDAGALLMAMAAVLGDGMSRTLLRRIRGEHPHDHRLIQRADDAERHHADARPVLRGPPRPGDRLVTSCSSRPVPKHQWRPITGNAAVGTPNIQWAQ